MTLKCIGKDNTEREFSLRVTKTYEGYPQFLVSHECIRGDPFELILKPLTDSSHIVIWIDAKDVYRGYGIPDAILPFAACNLLTEIHSSPTLAKETWRTDDATKVWRRLVAAGKAVYNEATDTFRLINISCD